MATNQPPYNPFPPAPVTAPPPPAQGNGLAIAGMVVGIVGLVFCWMPYVGAVISLVGVVLSALGMSRSSKVGKGKGMAIAGLICAVLGLVGGAYMTYVVTTAFKKYAGKTKAIEGLIQVNKIGRAAKLYYNENATFPPSAAPLPGAGDSACGEAGHKWPVVSTWAADPGWSALDFEVYEPTAFSYRYTKISETSAVIEAVGDADCDGTSTTITGRLTATNGSVTFDVSGGE